jgi:hypothetical protein
MLILVALAIGGTVAMGAPVFAIPIVFTILVIWGGARLAGHRERAGIGEEDVRGDAVDFDDRDRRTLAPSATPRGQRG